MSSIAESCMALFRDKKIQEKYIQYATNYGVGSKPVGKTGAEYRIAGKELESILSDYSKLIPLSEIAYKNKRSCCAIRRVLKKAGVYEVNRESAKTKLKGYISIKTIQIR